MFLPQALKFMQKQVFLKFGSRHDAYFILNTNRRGCTLFSYLEKRVGFPTLSFQYFFTSFEELLKNSPHVSFNSIFPALRTNFCVRIVNHCSTVLQHLVAQKLKAGKVFSLQYIFPFVILLIYVSCSFPICFLNCSY